AAGAGGRPVAARIRIRVDRIREARIVARRLAWIRSRAFVVETRRAFHHVPAEVETTRDEVAGRHRVDLFPRGLADVADVEIAGHPVEAEAERVAQALREDRPALRGRIRDVEIEAQQLAEEARRGLCAAPGVVAAAGPRPRGGEGE